MPEVEPRYAGYVAWRGVLEESDLPPAIHAALFEHFTFCLPDGELMLCLPMPGRDAATSHGRRRFHWVWYRPVDYDVALPTLCTDASGRRHGVAIPPPLIRAEVIAELKAQAQAVLAPQIAALVARTAQPLLQPIFDLAAPRIAVGRVALIGDAAFVARPHVGAGVTKAALDALALTETLTAGTSVAASLAEYDAQRRPLGLALVAHARRLGAYLEGRQAREAGHDPETVLRDYGAAAMPADTLRGGF
jgi:2-polyprenyl-6-methoxyphenol hydroxylase-like FAD-dependent oxidoreductase